MTSPTQASSPVRDWHAQSVATCVADLGTDAEPDLHRRHRAPARGVRAATNYRRRRVDHVCADWPPPSPPGFTNPLIVVLLVAGGVTLLLAHYVDAAVIFGVVVINAVIGFVQEG